MCSKEEMLNVAALLFRIKVNNDKSQLAMIPKMLKELVPADQQRLISESEWKKVREQQHKESSCTFYSAVWINASVSVHRFSPRWRFLLFLLISRVWPSFQV